VQFNQHVFAPITGVREERFADLEQKLGVLSPQLVRIFYSDADEGTPADGDHQTGTQQL